MFSETSISSEEETSTASESSRPDTCVDKPSTSSGSEHSEQFAERSLYCLALVNSETGDAVRVVTDEEAEEVARALAVVGNRSKAQGNATSASATPTSRQNSVARHKPGGPCDNCGVLDSPQWRRGPADAPVLCNACGTRFRRTSQLSSGGLRALKRAAEAQRQQQLVKHPKVNTLVACTV
ncbi:hypothetical protein ABBQ32_007813 [Trebouxia sp. C0010 RCD-2024]